MLPRAQRVRLAAGISAEEKNECFIAVFMIILSLLPCLNVPRQDIVSCGGEI